MPRSVQAGDGTSPGSSTRLTTPTEPDVRRQLRRLRRLRGGIRGEHRRTSTPTSWPRRSTASGSGPTSGCRRRRRRTSPGASSTGRFGRSSGTVSPDLGDHLDQRRLHVEPERPAALHRARAGPCTRWAVHALCVVQPAERAGGGAGRRRLRRPGGADIVFVGRPADGVGSRLGGPGIISLEIDDAVAGGGWIRWSLSSAPQSLAAGVTEGMTVRVVIR